MMNVLAEATEKALISTDGVDLELLEALGIVQDRTYQEQRILDMAKARGSLPLVNIRRMILAGKRGPLYPILAFAAAGAMMWECCDYGEGVAMASDAYGL